MSVSNTYFTCSETPLSLTAAQLTTIQKNQAYDTSVRISALSSGTGTIAAIPEGVLIDGSVSNSLSTNGQNYTWIDTRLVIPGLHVFNDVTPVAELCIYFKNDKRATDIYCICIPVQVGQGRGTPYFASLGVLQRSRPSFTTLLGSTAFIQYRGVDLRDRTEESCKNNVLAPSSTQSVQGNIRNYAVALEPAYIQQRDLTRLKASSGNTLTYKAKPVAAKSTLISYISSIEIATNAATKTVANGYVETAQVKCRPLDRTRDISGNLIYVGGKERKGDSSLEDELEGNATYDESKTKPTIDGSDIETILGIVLGAVIGIVVIAFVVVWVFRKTETNYLGTLKLYSSSGFQQASQFAEKAWQKLTPEPCKKVVENAVAIAKVGNP